MRIDECLKTILSEQEITLKEIAEKIGTRGDVVSRWVNGKSTPDLYNTVKILNALGYRLLIVKDEDL